MAQAKLVRRYAPNVTLLFDGDAAGTKATRDARDTCQQAQLVAKVAVLTGAKDPDEFVRERGAPALTGALQAARGILEHLIETVLDAEYNPADAQGRAARIKEIEHLIAGETDPTVRRMAESHAKLVAQRLGLSDAEASDPVLAAMTARLMQATAAPASAPADSHGHKANTGPDTGAPTAPPPPWRARSNTNVVQIGLDILGCFLDFPELLRDPNLQQVFDTLEGDTALAIAALRQHWTESDPLDITEVLAHLPGSIHTFAASRLAAPRHEHREQAEQEILRNTLKLRRLGLSRQKAQVVEALHRMERNGDPDTEFELLRDLYARHARERAGSSR